VRPCALLPLSTVSNADVPLSVAAASTSNRRLLPRCVEAQGSIIGGNDINYTSPALTLADVDAQVAAEAKAAREAQAAADAKAAAAAKAAADAKAAAEAIARSGASSASDEEGADHDPPTPELVLCAEMLEKLIKLRDAKPFAKPMQEIWSEEVMTDYRAVIKRPMDLRTVLEKVRRGEYNDDGPEAFADDVRLVWQNCITYIVRQTFPLHSICSFCARIHPRNIALHLSQAFWSLCSVCLCLGGTGRYSEYRKIQSTWFIRKRRKCRKRLRQNSTI
jgi:hypothetical protein